MAGGVAAHVVSSAPTHVALLRGINVGRAKRVAMPDLRALVEGLGYGAVKTLLNSGNVVFAARASDRRDHGARIEKALRTELGLESRVTVIDAATVAHLVERNPLAAAARDPSRLLVAVFRDPSCAKKLAPLAARDWSPGALAVGRGGAWLWCPEGLLDSPAAIELARALGDAVTTRNAATMAKLHALLGGAAA